MFRLLAGAAVLAMAAAPVYAQPGKNGNNGNTGQGKAAPSAKSQGKGNGNGNGNVKAKAASPAPKSSGPSQRSANAPANSAKKAPNAQANRGNGKSNGNARGNANDKSGGQKANRGNGQPSVIDARGGQYRDGYAGSYLRDALSSNRGMLDGCPPGLAKKRNGCLPPGQAKQRYRSYQPGLFGLAGLTGSGYYLNDGYLLRYNDDGLAGFIPLLAGALSIGNQWPDTYGAAPLPDYYVDYYRLGTPRSYRYADNVVYRVDPETAAIGSIAAILTGDDFTIGQPMPRGYDVYNVPYAYRDRYYDTPDARYRYADGYVYRIDPETALITAAIDLII